MAITFTDENPSVVVPAGNDTTTPFSKVTVTDTVPGNTETVTVTLSGSGEPPIVGSLTDPTGGGTWNPTTDTFTETALNTGSPSAATTILQRLVYTPPTVAAGQEVYVDTTVNVNGVYDNPYNENLVYQPMPQSVSIVTAGAPTINYTAASQPVVSGNTIEPFGSVQVYDVNAWNSNDTVTITVTDGGAATDADGLLSGTGLSKTGVGTYTVALPYELDQLVFTPSAVAAGDTRTTAFSITVNDSQTGLSANATTSVDTIGPTPTPTPPLIAGAVSGQTVVEGNTIDPFRGVTITDTNTSPSDSATITINGGGTLSGNGLTGSNGTYSVAATSPGALSATLENLVFTAPTLASGQTSNTSNLVLTVTDGTLSATNNTTTITTTDPPPSSASGSDPTQSGNFTVVDQTTGQTMNTDGQPYSGPVAGLGSELIDITTDNLNITANTPNVFIHSGSGNDAIDVSHANGNNVLDGSTGSNYLTGGTGNDQFYVDDRSPSASIWTTIANFHAGDSATIWGLTPQDGITEANNVLPTSPGLDFAINGTPDVNLTIAGYSTADLSNGHLAISFGTTPSLPGLAGSNYMLIQAS